jgi:predicted nucleic acid-binding protein
VIVGLDANILCYALDDAYVEHKKTKELLLNLSSENRIAVNPTIIHEAYHVLVYSQKWLPQDASGALKILLKNPYLEFFSQTKNISQIALSLSEHYKLGGRDGLIVANFIANKLALMYTHDEELVILQKIKWKNSTLNFQDPISIQ